MTNRFPRFSSYEYEKRHKALVGLMEREGIDVLLCYGDSTSGLNSEANVAYLTNCFDIYYEFLIFARNADPELFISNPLYLPNAKEMAVIESVQGIPRGISPLDILIPKLRDHLKTGKLGLTRSPILKTSLPYYQELSEVFGKEKIVDCTNLLFELRQSKSSEEMDWFKKGAMLTEQCLDSLFGYLKVGTTEIQAEGLMFSACASQNSRLGVGFLGFTAASSPEIIFPRQFQTSRPLQKGDLILTEVSASHFGYCGQMQRPAIIGESPPREYASLYEQAASIYHDLVDMIRDGTSCSTIRTFLNRLEEKGIRTFDVVAHGWGLEGVTDPLIDPDSPEVAMIKRPSSDLILKEGMLLVVQPNLVKGPYGLQVGNLVQVGKNKCQPLQREIEFRTIGS